ncbi:MAG: hypothetical protein ACRC2V_27935 [Xenococcaceae cyanobacterium]
MSNLNLSQFNVFIGETGAIDRYPGNLIASTFLYDLPNLDLQALDRKIDHAIDGLDLERKKKVEEVLRAIGFDPKILEKDYRKNRAERLACLYFSVVVSDFLPQIIGFKDFGLYFDPRLGRRVTQELIKLTKDYDKIIFLSTQNVGCLDGLDLDDDFQRLFVVSYNIENIPIAHREKSPKPLEGQEPVELSEAYLRGYLGGLSNKF